MQTKTTTPSFTSGFQTLKVMLFTLLFAVLTMAAQEGFASGSPAPVHHKGIDAVKLGGDIIMVGDLAIADTHSANTIVLFQVWHGVTMVYSSSGCYSTRCTYDLSGLATGTYHAVATDNDSRTFEDDVDVQ